MLSCFNVTRLSRNTLNARDARRFRCWTLVKAVFTLVTASAFFTTSKNGLDHFGDHQLGVRLNFDADVKKLQSTSKRHDATLNLQTTCLVNVTVTGCVTHASSVASEPAARTSMQNITVTCMSDTPTVEFPSISWKHFFPASFRRTSTSLAQVATAHITSWVQGLT